MKEYLVPFVVPILTHLFFSFPDHSFSYFATGCLGWRCFRVHDELGEDSETVFGSLFSQDERRGESHKEALLDSR